SIGPAVHAEHARTCWIRGFFVERAAAEWDFALFEAARRSCHGRDGCVAGAAGRAVEAATISPKAIENPRCKGAATGEECSRRAVPPPPPCACKLLEIKGRQVYGKAKNLEAKQLAN